MKPDVPRFLGVAAFHLMGRTAPGLSNLYEQSTATTIGGLLVGVIEEFERAASRRVEENAALRALFRAAETAVEDAALADRLRSAADQTDESLMVSALEASNAALRALLIELHVHLETLATEEARSLEAEIWKELVVSTERRRLAMGPF